MEISKVFIVKPEETAEFVGSGGLQVLATPMLIAYIENVCFEWLENELQDNETSVGVHIEVSHLKPTKVSEKVNIVVDIIEKTDRKATFECAAFQGEELIGTANHKRVIVDQSSFLKKL
ncbi:thioesterase family protein [Vagococcus xieshaowenii]|uniref:Fluoroacetyl-CoA-specific thioesterase-like domain-containing protein n=1 Tax=Vagococcus xieshaowenii TaxID=2562451 RepID=A0AAJ5EEJ7_9ENTE|nr:thioesterase family protein [Vagococcus xieshaowenii]QCA28703.1 hypothetical protein E4Z98_04990 [Vagococcus xieshaowenii]TFZ40488.1 hypothetical protein E4031_06785 [Vagococcus xieshaowenii]